MLHVTDHGGTRELRATRVNDALRARGELGCGVFPFVAAHEEVDAHRRQPWAHREAFAVLLGGEEHRSHAQVRRELLESQALVLGIVRIERLSAYDTAVHVHMRPFVVVVISSGCTKTGGSAPLNRTARTHPQASSRK